MGFCLKPNTVYKTKLTTFGTVIFQPKGGNIQLFGTNVTLYDKTNLKKLILPKFEELIVIWDDWMQENTVNPMNCLTTFIGFIADNPETVVWVNEGIDVSVTPTFDMEYFK